MKKVLSKRGFTFIELMIVTVVLAVIGMAVYGTFVNGISLWQRATEESIHEELAVFFEKISYDLRNTFKLTGMRFRGEKDLVAFPVRMKENVDDELMPSIGEVSYFFDVRKKALNKRLSSYSEVYRKKPGHQQTLVEGVRSLDFEYYVYDERKKKYSWERQWQERDNTFGAQVEERIPLIVRIKVGVKEEDRERTYTKTVALPSACCWPFEGDAF